LIFKKIILISCITISLAAPLHSQKTKSSLSAGEQRHAQRGLKNNLYFLAFINSTITNSGTEKERQIYTEAVQRDLLARTVYMKFQFHEAFTEIKKSQILLIELMEKLTQRGTAEAISLLNEFAPHVLKSEDRAAKKYISLGYRSANEAGKVALMADNLPETNYSIRIYEYIKSLKLAKYARRYAIIAMIEYQLEPGKKGKTPYNDYEKTAELINTYLKDDAERLQDIHSDNYYKFDNNSSCYDMIMSKPELEKIPEYEKYRKEE